MPKVSVLLPVKNGERYIHDAMASILNQTFQDFEVLVVDDGSSDQTSLILDQFQDARIIRIRHESSLGLSSSLNAAFSISNGEYIARMDSDDIADPTRLEKQVEVLDRRKDVVLCSTNIQEIGPDDEVRMSHRWPLHESRPLEWLLLFETPIAHPTVLFRRSAISAGEVPYRQVPAEDHDLWTRLVLKGRIQRIPEVLLKYRIHGDSTYLNTKVECLEESMRSSAWLAESLGVGDVYPMELSEFYLSRKKYRRSPDFKPAYLREAWSSRISGLARRWNWSPAEEKAALSDMDHRIFKTLVLEKRWRDLWNDSLRHPLVTLGSVAFYVRRKAPQPPR